MAACLFYCGLYLAIIISHCRRSAVNRCLRPTQLQKCVWLRLASEDGEERERERTAAAAAGTSEDVEVGGTREGTNSGERLEG